MRRIRAVGLLWNRRSDAWLGIDMTTEQRNASFGRLEQDGFLTRETDGNDRRAVLLKLTEAGQQRADELRAERDGWLDELFSGLTEEEKQTLSDLLDKLI